MSGAKETGLRRLRRRAEHALEHQKHTEAETLLDRLVEIADGDDALFAHRHLAEIRLERHPWRAALHLRHVLQACPDDDVPHALMGLSQALLGNFRAAVASYRKALQYAPGTPWYLHNLGHLLDVALDAPRAALEPLETAHAAEPEHDEIAASLAHCQARLGSIDSALTLARQALALAPSNRDHARLVGWIEAGAPDDWSPQDTVDIAQASKAPKSIDPTQAVQEMFEAKMKASGFTGRQVELAGALWRDFGEGRELRMRKPEVYAAAIEYAIATVHKRGTTQAKVARRYGIAPGSLVRRYGEIRQALDLQPDDPRYA